MATEKIPNVTVLVPIRPSSNSDRSERLEYNNLASAVEKHVPHTYDRWQRFERAEPGRRDEGS